MRRYHQPALDYPCGNCGDELESGKGKVKRRRVPRRGGRLLYVCLECARAIDLQTVLEEPKT